MGGVLGWWPVGLYFQPLSSGIWILDFRLGFATWDWDLGLGFGLDNYYL